MGKYYCAPQLNAKKLCDVLGLSEKQLLRKLKALVGLGLSEWVRDYRLNKACELFSDGQRVSQIYDEVGFSSHSYLSSCFKAKFGVTPKNDQSSD
ncbi:MAG: AraC-like DNA-binding protein [Alteromonadaceae bacterium]